MRRATAGTVLAAREALRSGGVVMNLSGGYHHASAGRGEGFCVYADVGVAVAVLRRDGLLGRTDRVVHVDLDAHQGNGVARVFADDPSVFLLDLYNRDIYPHDAEARRRVDCDLPVPSGYDDARYLATVTRELPRFLDALCGPGRAKPHLAFYNAGTDVLSGDPLGRLDVSAAGIFERDRFVIGELSRHQVPTVILSSGGYTRASFQLLARTAAWVLETQG
jgi:histone deacetylase 11